MPLLSVLQWGGRGLMPLLSVPQLGEVSDAPPLCPPVGEGLTHLLSVPQCAPGGCLMELCIQLSIIMLGKQLIQNNLFEIGIP